MKNSEILFLTGLAAAAGAFLWNGLDMPYDADQSFGPGFVPVNMAIAILVLVGLVVARAALSRAAPAEEAAEAVDRSGLIAVIGAIALIAATVFAARFGSLLLPLGASMMIVTAIFLERGWRVAAISTIASLAVIYAIFAVWLKIPVV